MLIAWTHCHNCWHHCQTYQRQPECFLHQGHARQNHDGHRSVHDIPYFLSHVFLLQVPNDCNYIEAYAHYSGNCPACTVPCTYQTVKVLNPDLLLFWWHAVTPNLYSQYPVIKCHSLHQYAPEYSCEKISASAPHQGGESSLLYAKGLAATEFGFC